MDELTLCINTVQPAARSDSPPATLAPSYHRSAERGDSEPSKQHLYLPHHHRAESHVHSARLCEVRQQKEAGALLTFMRDRMLFQSYKCKCANERSEHFFPLAFTSAAQEAQMLHHCQHW